MFKRFLRSETAVYLLGLTGLWVLFFWRFAASDQATRWVFADGDFTLQFGLFRDLVYRQLVQGHLPLWERCLYAGYPIYADPQTQLFYPPSWLAYIGLKVLGWGHYPIEAFTLEAISHFLLGSWFCYWFLRRSDLPASVALFGAALFTYSGYLTAYPVLQTATLYTEIWLPLILLQLLAFSQKQQWRSLAWAALFLAISYTGGHPQTFIYVLLISCSYWALQAWLHKLGWRKWLAGQVSLGVLTGLLASVQLLPSLQFIFSSTRSTLAFEAATKGFPFQDIIQFVLPKVVSHWHPLYIGILPLTLLGVALRRLFTPTVLFWAILALVSLLLSFGSVGVVYDIAYAAIPVLRLFRGQEHFALPVTFGLVMVATYGFAALLQAADLPERSTIQRGLFGLLVLGLLGIAVTVTLSQTALGDLSGVGNALGLLVLASGLAWTVYALWGRVPRSLWAVLLLVAVMFDLFTHNRGQDVRAPFNPYPPQAFLLPVQQTADFFRVQDDYRLPGHSGCGYGFAEISGITPYKIAGYQTLLDQAPEAVRWALLGVRYVVTWRETLYTREGTLPESRLIASGKGPVFAAEPTYVHALKAAPQQAFWVANALPYQDSAELFAGLAQPDFEPFQQIYLAADSLPTGAVSAPGQAVATLTAPTAQAGLFVWDVQDAPQAGWLVVSEAYFNGWQATVDGVPAPVLAADGALLAVAVPAGTHTVRLTFAPPILTWGALLSGLGLVVVLGLLLFGQRPNTSQKRVAQR